MTSRKPPGTCSVDSARITEDRERGDLNPPLRLTIPILYNEQPFGASASSPTTSFFLTRSLSMDNVLRRLFWSCTDAGWVQGMTTTDEVCWTTAWLVLSDSELTTDDKVGRNQKVALQWDHWRVKGLTASLEDHSACHSAEHFVASLLRLLDQRLCEVTF